MSAIPTPEWTKADKSAEEVQEASATEIGMAANDLAFLQNPYQGPDYNIFLSAWRAIAAKYHRKPKK